MAIPKIITLEQLNVPVRSPMYPKGISAIERFWSKVDRSDAEDCWEWTASTHAGPRSPAHRYGQFKTYGIAFLAHRFAWLVTNGDILDSLFVLHRCDNPLCCNPAHLFLGTHDDNMVDMHEKGRFVSNHAHLRGCQVGERQWQAKLTAEQVRFIRERTDLSGPELAKRFGINKATVNRIRQRQRWAHV